MKIEFGPIRVFGTGNYSDVRLGEREIGCLRGFEGVLGADLQIDRYGVSGRRFYLCISDERPPHRSYKRLQWNGSAIYDGKAALKWITSLWMDTLFERRGLPKNKLLYVWLEEEINPRVEARAA